MFPSTPNVVHLWQNEEDMDYVLDQLDMIQSSPEEKKAQEELQAYKMKDTSEWDHGSINNGVIIGDIDQGDQVYFNLLDESEMNQDMDLWDMEEACHEYFANGGQIDVSLPVVITKVGEKYSTGECDMGKVYVPNIALNFFHTSPNEPSQWCHLQFKGFENSRTNPNGHKKITMPWRCMKVE